MLAFEWRAGTMRSVLIVCAVIAIFLYPNVNDAVIFRFTNYVCESYNKTWAIFYSCRLKAIGRDKITLYSNGTLLYPAHNITLHVRIFKRANGYKPWLIDRKIDICRFLRRRTDPVMKVVYGFVTEYTNMNHSCPYVGPAIIKGFYLRPELLRLPLPTGDYMLAIDYYFDSNLTVGGNISFSFVEDLMNSK